MLIMIAGMLAMISIVVAMLRTRPALVFSLSVVYSVITSSASLLYLESSRAFISETQIFSTSTGATVRHTIYVLTIYLFAFAGLTIYHKLFGKVRPRSNRPNILYIRYSWFIIFCILLQTINVLLSGHALSGDRHGLWFHVPFPILREVLGVLVAFAPFFSGALLAISLNGECRKLRNYAAGILLMYFFYLIVSSQSFHGLLFGGILFFAPLFFLLEEKRKFKWGKAFLAVIALTCAAFIYGGIGIENRGISQFGGGTAAGTMIYRVLVLQGGVYFTSDIYAGLGTKMVDSSLLFGEMKQLQLAIMSPELALAYSARGVNLAGSLPGSAVLVFGYVGAIPVLALYGLILGYICAWIGDIVSSAHPVPILLASYVMVWTAGVYVRGSFDQMLDAKFITFVVLLFIFDQIFKPRQGALPLSGGRARLTAGTLDDAK